MLSRDEKNLRILFYKRGETNLEKEYLLKLRGIIYDLNTGEIVMQSLYGGIEFDKINGYDINDLSFYESIDGTLINAYFYNDKWNFSTKGMIDADSSRWFSDKSFKSLFMEAINDLSLNHICVNHLLFVESSIYHCKIGIDKCSINRFIKT